MEAIVNNQKKRETKVLRSDNLEEINVLKQSLRRKFAIKDLRRLKYFFDIEMATSHRGLFLNQRKYVLDLLKESEFWDSKPASISLDSRLQFETSSVFLSDVTSYQRLVGSAGRCILLKNHGNTYIMGYTDADWAGNSLDRKSTTGFCTFVGENLVTWKSKKQTIVARSSAEAEYRAMTATACELIWLKSLLSDLGSPCSQPIL
ncbi:hypothetical protein ACLB2K_030490 [Fragaria x ananassa]